MPLRIRCPSGHKLIVPDDRAGRSLRCPRCGQVTEVPGERVEPTAAAPAVERAAISAESTAAPPASSSGSGVFDWPNAIAAPTTIPPLVEPPIAAEVFEPAIEPPPPPVVKPKSRALPLPEPSPRPERRALPERPATPPEPPPRPVAPFVAAPIPPPLPPPQPRMEWAPSPLPAAPPVAAAQPAAAPAAATSEPVATVVPPEPAAPLPAPEPPPAVPPPLALPSPAWPGAETPAPVPVALTLGADRGNVWAAYQLAAALIVAALFSMAPAVWDVAEYLQFPEGQFVARWALVLFLLGLVQVAYAAYLIQLPDWTSVWVVTIYSLALAAVYAATLGLVLISSESGIVVTALQLSDKLAGGKAVLWCLSMVSLSTILAFFAGRLSARWHTREATLRSAGLHH